MGNGSGSRSAEEYISGSGTLREIKRLMLTKNIKAITQTTARRLNTLTPIEECMIDRQSDL